MNTWWLFLAVSDLCQKVDPLMSDKMKVHYLLGGVDPRLRNHLALLDLKSTAEVLAKLRVLKVDPSSDGKSVVLTLTKSDEPMETPASGSVEFNAQQPWWVYQNTFKLEQDVFIKPGLQARNTKKKTKN